MSAFDAESSKQANDKQRQKYPDFSEEMRRRGAMTQNRGSGATEDNYGGKAGLSREMSRRAKIRWEKKRAETEQASKSQETAQDFDRTQEV